jgi:hypothetical protein
MRICLPSLEPLFGDQPTATLEERSAGRDIYYGYSADLVGKTFSESASSFELYSPMIGVQDLNSAECDGHRPAKVENRSGIARHANAWLNLSPA